MQKNLSVLNAFTEANLPTLDVVLLGALERFIQEPILTLDIKKMFTTPLVVGSGNAEVTGKIMFDDMNAVFASESSAEQRLATHPGIDGVVVISASGEKHAPVMVNLAHQHNKKVVLITNNSGSSAEKLLSDMDTAIVLPKNREPYTYNTSTYLGMILAVKQEDPHAILSFITSHIDTLTLPDFSAYKKFFLVVPPEFAPITRMFQIKFIELFGRRIARDIETSEYMKHAATVIPSDELFINFGIDNPEWGNKKNTLNIPLSDGANFASVMAIGYYIIGQIQKKHPYFADYIAEYIERTNATYGSGLSVIVE